MRHGFLGAVAITACVVVGAGAAGCGGGPGARAVNLQPGDMPAGESWAGVYYHPVFGYLHMQEQDTNVVARWKRTDQSAWGELSGTKLGNVLHYTWSEHKYGLVGPSASSRGKGYFVFKVGANAIAELDGQYGLDADETGSDWHCVKQQGMKADLKSITGDLAGTAPPAGQKWD